MVKRLSNTPKSGSGIKQIFRRILSSSRILLVLLLISIVQYADTGRVSWVTDTFRWFESTATGLNLNPGAILEKTGGVIGDLARRVQQPAPDGGSSDMLEEEKPDIDVVSLPGHTYGLAGKVVKVADGDTLTLVDAEGKRVKIRLFGIDTPERDQPYYNRAKSALSRLVANKTVDVDIKDIDSYGRTVGVVYVKGRSINLKMVRLGHAWWYRRYAGLNQTLRDAEEQARRGELGLWASSNPVAPWDWRRQRR